MRLTGISDYLLAVPRLLHGRRHQAPGTPPGTVAPRPEASPTLLRVFGYGAGGCAEAADLAVHELGAWRREHRTLWVDVVGLGTRETITGLGAAFALHPLALEDVVNTHQRPKAETYPDHLFVVARMVTPGPPIGTEQLALFVGDGWVITFQELAGDPFEPVRARLREGRGRIRGAGADYLAYALLDAVVDHYYPVIEDFAERLETIEADLLADRDADLLPRIHAVKRELVTLRRAVWPLRDALGTLLRDEHPLIDEQTKLYLRDCHDHTQQIADLLEACREESMDHVGTYLSLASNRLNDVMKVLTIIATIFIPLGFMAGVYGMNFAHMPELDEPWGYPAALAAMALVALGLLVFFWRKGWILGRHRQR